MENTLENSLVEQLAMEMKDYPEQDVEDMPTYSKKEISMLRQKYGLVAPELTASEKNLIQKEERKNGRT